MGSNEVPASWHQWCRLCAEKHSAIDVFFKNEDNCDVAKLIERFFQLSINPEDKAPVTICPTCYHFLLSLAKFSERVVKVQAMYASIVNDGIIPREHSSLEVEFKLVKDEPLDINIEYLYPDTYGSDDNLERSGTNHGNKENGIHTKVKEKNDPLVHPLIPADNFPKEENPSVSETSIKHPELDEIEDSDSEEGTDTEAKPKLKTENPKKRGRKRKEPPFPCDKCDKVFLQRNAFRAHRSICQKVFTCQHCDKKFRSQKGAHEHQMTHVEPNQRPTFPCPHCDKHFTQARNIQTHIRAVHFGERPFICETCGKAFAAKGALQKHSTGHVSETPFQCLQCSKKFKTLVSLKRHEDIHDSTNYPCPKCNRILNTKHTLQMHMAVHSSEKKHKCTVCNSAFKRGWHLKNHMTLHSGERPHKCLFCSKTFVHGSHCRNHMKQAHPQEASEEKMES